MAVESGVEETADQSLLDAVRAGDTDAFGELYGRHALAVRRLARALSANPADADDLVSDAFASTLHALQSGHGPHDFLRGYLLRAVRNLAAQRARERARTVPVEDFGGFEPTEEHDDPVVSQLDVELTRTAFHSLPERWQTVLWHSEVEDETPAVIAPVVGLKPNAVSALVARARTGLQRAYLSAAITHVPEGEGHREALGLLGPVVHGSASRRDQRRLHAHLDECDYCRGVAAELADLRSTMRRRVAAGWLGAAAGPYLLARGGETVLGAGAAAPGVPAKDGRATARARAGGGAALAVWLLAGTVTAAAGLAGLGVVIAHHEASRSSETVAAGPAPDDASRSASSSAPPAGPSGAAEDVALQPVAPPASARRPADPGRRVPTRPEVPRPTPSASPSPYVPHAAAAPAATPSARSDSGTTPPAPGAGPTGSPAPTSSPSPTRPAQPSPTPTPTEVPPARASDFSLSSSSVIGSAVGSENTIDAVLGGPGLLAGQEITIVVTTSTYFEPQSGATLPPGCATRSVPSSPSSYAEFTCVLSEPLDGPAHLALPIRRQRTTPGAPGSSTTVHWTVTGPGDGNTATGSFSLDVTDAANATAG